MSQHKESENKNQQNSAESFKREENWNQQEWKKYHPNKNSHTKPTGRVQETLFLQQNKKKNTHERS